jgi:hypothetical protein
VDLAVEFADLGIANQFVDVIELRENKVFWIRNLMIRWSVRFGSVCWNGLW